MVVSRLLWYPATAPQNGSTQVLHFCVQRAGGGGVGGGCCCWWWWLVVAVVGVVVVVVGGGGGRWWHLRHLRSRV